MATVETEGLVLKTYNLSDADKIVIFLTEKEGLIRGVAKGAKRLKSKFGGSLEPFTIVDLAFSKKEERELVMINDIELVRSFFKDTSQIEFLQRFTYLAELLTDFAPPHDPNKRLYNMSKICFQTAADNPADLDGITFYFEIWVLKLGGYLPLWEKCYSCKKEFDDSEITVLQSDFQILCKNCQTGRNGLHISSLQRHIYCKAQKQSPHNFAKFSRYATADIATISGLLKRIMSQVLGRELSDRKFLYTLPN